jgi:hypothetical protein
MCNTNPENGLKPIWHPGHVKGRVMLSSGFKGSLDSFTSFPFALLLLRVKLVATESDPSKFDTEELVFLGPHKLDITKEKGRSVNYLGVTLNNIQRGVVSTVVSPRSANLLRKAARATKERKNGSAD